MKEVRIHFNVPADQASFLKALDGWAEPEIRREEGSVITLFYVPSDRVGLNRALNLARLNPSARVL